MPVPAPLWENDAKIRYDLMSPVADHWVAVRKQTGRGEGSSGLAFDRLFDSATSLGGGV